MYRHLITVLVASSAMTLAACGGGSHQSNPATVPCVISLSGALTGTLACASAPELTYYSSSDTTKLYVSSQLGPSSGNELSGVATVTFSGHPVAKTVKSGDSGVIGDVEVFSPSGATWTATVGEPAKIEAGSMSVTISSVGDITEANQGNTHYACHGRFQATLPEDTADSVPNPVMLDATF